MDAIPTQNFNFMKKHLLFICLSIFSIGLSFGQLKKGDIFVGAELGNVGFGISDRPNLIAAGLAPQIGLMISPKIALGLRTKFQYLHWRTNTTSGNNFQYEAGIFGRYWFKNEGVVRPFVELAAGAGTDTGIGRNYANWMYEEASGGVSLMVSDRLGIDLGLGLRAQQPMNLGTNGSSLQLRFKAGLNFYINGKKKQ